LTWPESMNTSPLNERADDVEERVQRQDHHAGQDHDRLITRKTRYPRLGRGSHSRRNPRLLPPRVDPYHRLAPTVRREITFAEVIRMSPIRPSNSPIAAAVAEVVGDHAPCGTGMW